VLVSGGLLALRVALWRPLAVAGEAPRDGFTRVAGVLHVHTNLSDGGGSPEEVVAAARVSGLDFLAITDHNNLEAKPHEGYHGRLLVLVGCEVSTTSGHLLGLGIPDPAYRFSGDARDATQDIRDLGGVAFAAHSENARADFRWTDWDLPGPWGMELLNGDSQWRAAGWAQLLGTAGLYGLNRPYALLGSLTSPAASLARWDALLAQRDVAGIAGADAHSRVPWRRDRALRFPSYESLFGLVRNHVLLENPPRGDAARDGRALLDALSHGRSFLGLDGLAPAGGFSFEAQAGGRRYAMGDTLPSAPAPLLRAGGVVPPSARLVLLKDGRVLREATGALEVVAPGPGVYRVEARVPGREVPWVISNPIYVFDPAAATARALRAAWPADPPAPIRVTQLDSFDGGSKLEPEADSYSEVARPILDPRAGIGGSGAARLAFRLGAPGSGHPHTYCALVDRTSRDLSGRQGLSFWIRADGVYRIWVQVRDANPASTDEGTEWWFASVRTSIEWRRVSLPFACLRSVNPRSDGRLDLDKLRAIVFVLDRGAVKVGTRGTIWLDDLGVY
jgi:hypothetical protein